LKGRSLLLQENPDNAQRVGGPVEGIPMFGREVLGREREPRKQKPRH
jgi:hypothetical protein